MRRTKIVCTIGPSSRSPRTVRQLVSLKTDVFRINFSHGDRTSHLEEIARIRAAARSAGRTVAILQDLPGPKIRVGKVRSGSVDLQKGGTLWLTPEEIVGDERRLSLNYPALLSSVRSGTTLYLADGIIRLRVEETTSKGVRTTVLAGGTLSSGKGVNAPGVKMKVEFPTQKDVEHLEFGIKKGVDFIALSFVRSAADVKAVRRLIPGGNPTPLIVKIEKREAVSDFGSILHEADGVMIARGDLGIEVPIERVPIIQKEFVRKCNKAGKPVIVATQMLVSMVNFPVPSRAEVTDVSNAILDGADAVMLSDETAVGRYPVESARMLDRISRFTEKVFKEYGPPPLSEQLLVTEDAIARAACDLANSTDARSIVAPTQSGTTARRVSKHRPSQPIIALCTEPRVARQLQLSWGVVPMVARQANTTDELFAEASKAASSLGFAKKGDRIVVTSGTPGVKGSTDLVKVITLTR